LFSSSLSFSHVFLEEDQPAMDQEAATQDLVVHLFLVVVAEVPVVDSAVEDSAVALAVCPGAGGPAGAGSQ
jgi:hypothetical protein